MNMDEEENTLGYRHISRRRRANPITPGIGEWSRRGAEASPRLQTARIVGEQGSDQKYVTDGPSSLDMSDGTSKTPLHYSALHSWTNCVQLLLTRGVKITADIDNMTALHYTVSKSSK